MKKLEKIISQPSEQPIRNIDKLYPKFISCTEIIYFEYQDFTFKVSVYELHGNGRKYIEMFDKSEKQLLTNLEAFQYFNWTEFYTLSVKGKLNIQEFRENEISFEKNYNRNGNEFRLEHLFKKLISIYKLYVIEENLNSFESLN